MRSSHTRFRFLRFLLVGGTGFVVQLGSLWLLKWFFPVRVAFTVAFVLSVASHYSLNRFWALKSARRDSGRQFLEYLATVGLSYLVSYSFFNLFLYLKLSAMLSTALAVPPSTLVVFLLLNYRVFRHRDGGAAT